MFGIDCWPKGCSLVWDRYEWGWDHEELEKGKYIDVQLEEPDLQATLVNSCLAKFWIWLLGNGTKPLPLRKSNTLWPSRSVTIQIWLRKSKESRRCMHLFRFVLSFRERVERTRSSIREASRYFCTERMILTAHLVFFRLSYASTTLPNVPWPRSLTTESDYVSSRSKRSAMELTSLR